MGGRSGAARQYNRSKVPRLRWTAELHCSFLRAIDCLGGRHKATPKLILQLMGVRGLTISHVKSHLQMYRGTRHDIGQQKDMQPQQHLNKHSFVIDMGPPIKRARAVAEAAGTLKGMQGSSDNMRTPAGTRNCIDDCMQLQAMSPMDRRRSAHDGLMWQKDDASNLKALGFLVQGREPFKIHQVCKPEAHHLNHMVRKLSSKEDYKSRCFMVNSAASDEPGEPAKKCSASPSLAIGKKAAKAISSWPNEGSCIISPSPRSFSDWSGPPGCSFVGQRVNLDLSLSICGS